MNFKGIDLSPGALIMRQRADRLSDWIAEHEKILEKAMRLGCGSPNDRQAAGRQLEDCKRALAMIEKEITS